MRMRRFDTGFTYLGLIIMVAIIGIAAAATLQVGSVLQRHAAEQELLEIGSEFQVALQSYANATPAGKPQSPANLQELLKDPRYPNPRRHLRKIYADPITGKEEWGTIPTLDGRGIIGVFSLAEGTPIKIGNFSPPFQSFEGKTTYRDWVFLFRTQTFLLPGQPKPAPAPSLFPALQNKP
jgi:type II secretory pathway pseudopilin PulG